MTEYILVKTNEAFGLADTQTRAIVRDGIALQPKFPDDRDPRGWHVIHVLSGLSLYAGSLASAKRAFRFFVGYKINGVRLADIPPCELCNLSTVMADDFLSHMNLSASLFHPVVERASLLSKLLSCDKAAA